MSDEEGDLSWKAYEPEFLKIKERAFKRCIEPNLSNVIRLVIPQVPLPLVNTIIIPFMIEFNPMHLKLELLIAYPGKLDYSVSAGNNAWRHAMYQCVCHHNLLNPYLDGPLDILPFPIHSKISPDACNLCERKSPFTCADKCPLYVTTRTLAELRLHSVH